MNVPNSRMPDGGSRRGLPENSGEPRFLVIGRIIKPHGTGGEMRVEVLTELPERFDWLERVYVGREDPKPIPIEAVRFHQSWVLIKLSGVDDRDAAEGLRSEWLQVPEEEGIPLDEGEYYLYQALGLSVVTDQGQALGEISEIIETGANYVFVVTGPQGEVLIPDTDEVVLEVDLERGRMLVHLLDGLLR